MQEQDLALTVPQVLTHAGVSWVDVENPNATALTQLQEQYQLHPVHVQESVHKVQHNQVEHEENYLFLILHVPIFESHVGKIIINQVGVFLGKDFLVTIQMGNSPTITDFFKLCQTDAELMAKSFEQSSSYLLYVLISRFLDSITDMTDAVENELDKIEDEVFDSRGSDSQRIGRIRQKIVKLSRVIGPKRFVLQDLAEQINAFSDKNMAKYYASNTKTVNKLWEIIEEAQETVEIYKDADFTTSTEQTNEILALLTIIFTFTIPITVVGTLYGMNVPLPGGLATGAWTFLGQYTSFGVLVALSLLMAGGMYLYFKNKHWF